MKASELVKQLQQVIKAHKEEMERLKRLEGENRTEIEETRRAIKDKLKEYDAQLDALRRDKRNLVEAQERDVSQLKTKRRALMDREKRIEQDKFVERTKYEKHKREIVEQIRKITSVYERISKKK